jgi:hypothetical protein
MKKTILFIVIAAALLICGNVFADKLIFTELGISYGTVVGPAYLSNDSTGVFDTAVYDIKVGAEILKWGDVYAGGGLNYYMVRSDWQDNYTICPVFGGLRVNIFPEWIVYPSLSAEYGVAFASYHDKVSSTLTNDKPWTAAYYNFAIAANWNLTDVSILRLSIERPAISNENGGEIHILKAGLAWKIFY